MARLHPASNRIGELVGFWDERGGSVFADTAIWLLPHDDMLHIPSCPTQWNQRLFPRNEVRLSVRELAGTDRCACVRVTELALQNPLLADPLVLFELHQAARRLRVRRCKPIAEAEHRRQVAAFIRKVGKLDGEELDDEMRAAFETVRDAVVREANEACAAYDRRMSERHDDSRLRRYVAGVMQLDLDQDYDDTYVTVGLVGCRESTEMRAAVSEWGVGPVSRRGDDEVTAVVCMPLWALPWLTDNIPWRQRPLEIVAEGDRRTAEAAACLWDPGGTGPLARLCNAVEAARNIDAA